MAMLEMIPPVCNYCEVAANFGRTLLLGTKLGSSLVPATLLSDVLDSVFTYCTQPFQLHDLFRKISLPRFFILPAPPMAPDTVTGGVTLSDPSTVCESAAEGSSCQGGLVGERPALPSRGAEGSPSGSWEGWGSQLCAAGWWGHCRKRCY